MRSIAVLCAIATPTNALTWQALDAQLPKTPAPTIIDAVHHRSSPPPLPDDVPGLPARLAANSSYVEFFTITSTSSYLGSEERAWTLANS